MDQRLLGVDVNEQIEVASGLTDVIEAHTLALNLGPWFENTGANIRQMQHNVSEFVMPEGETFFIVGPGASLERYRDFLPELRDLGVVIGQPTSYPFMRVAGLEPHVMIVADRAESQADSIREYTGPVIAPTTVHPRIGAEHETYFFTLYQGNGGPDDPRYGLINQAMHYLNRGALGPVGFVSLGDVTNLAAQIAYEYMLGEEVRKHRGKRICLVGIDRCYYKGMDRVVAGGAIPHIGGPDDITWRDHTSSVQMVVYQYKLYQWWRMFNPALYRLDHGIQTEIPFVQPDRIIKGKWPAEVDAKQATQEFLYEEWPREFPWRFGGEEAVRDELA